MDEKDSLERVAFEVRNCTKCPLSFGRTRAVPGDGAENAEIMFIGEGPGYHEDREGLPFVGPAGQFLDELLRRIGLKRETVFITNVVKCRPPGNRDPLPEELEACRGYLDRQIVIIKPRVIVTLGRYSMQRYFPGASISRVHGQARQIGSIQVVAMFHPAAALHQPKWRPVLESDFARLPALITQAREKDTPLTKNELPPEQPEQLSLF